MSNYSDLSYSQLQKKYNAHLKSKKSKPDEKTFKDKEKISKDAVNENKLQLAELKYDLERIRGKTDKMRTQQQAMNSKLKDASKTLQKRKEQTKEVYKQLADQMGLDGAKMPKRIQNPKERLKGFQDELNAKKQSLRLDDLATSQEKKIMRDIKVLEASIKQVDKYLQHNVQEVWEKKDETQKNVDEFREEHNTAFENFKTAREQANEAFSDLDDNRKQQDQIQDKIKEQQKARESIQTDYKKQMDAWQSWQRMERQLKTAMNEKQYDVEIEADTKKESKKKSGAKASEAKKEVEQEKAKLKKAQEQLQSVEDRRAAAVAAYKQCQDNLKKKTTAPVAGGEVAAPEVIEKEDDPHQAEKDLCRSLIAYCQSNLPSTKKTDDSPKAKKKKKKKKKKIRLTHKPINFSNFAKVGVGIPIWSTDLEACIKNLEERISSYDNPDADTEESVKDTSVWDPWFYTVKFSSS